MITEITEENIRQAARRQPGRYILYSDKDGNLVQFDDLDTGYIWFKLPGGVWVWVV